MPFYYKSHGKEAPNAFVAFVRRIYNPLGFNRGYNFPLWVILAGAIIGFSASRAMWFNYDGLYGPDKVILGDWEYHRKGLARSSIIMHLATVVPVGFLVPWQFLPIVRYKAIMFHRINGYLLLLLLIGILISGVMVTPWAMGATAAARAYMYVLAAMTGTSALLTWINIKRLQIDQHRAWMLRTWVYGFSVISVRLINLASVPLITKVGEYYFPMPCHSIDFIEGFFIAPNLSSVYYPECEGNPNKVIAVLATTAPEPTPEGLPGLHHITAAARVAFAGSCFVALVIHMIAVEAYLYMTPAEAARLKRVSRERQLAKGYKAAGDSSFLTVEMLGDADEFNYGQKPENTDHDSKDLMKPEVVVVENQLAG